MAAFSINKIKTLEKYKTYCYLTVQVQDQGVSRAMLSMKSLVGGNLVHGSLLAFWLFLLFILLFDCSSPRSRCQQGHAVYEVSSWGESGPWLSPSFWYCQPFLASLGLYMPYSNLCIFTGHSSSVALYLFCS